MFRTQVLVVSAAFIIAVGGHFGIAARSKAIRCRSPCHEVDDAVVLSDTKQMSCSADYIGNTPWSYYNEITAPKPTSLKLKWYIDKGERIALNVTWTQKISDLDSGGVEGYYLQYGLIKMRVKFNFRGINGSLSSLREQRYLRFFYECIGVRGGGTFFRPNDNIIVKVTALPMHLNDTTAQTLKENITIPDCTDSEKLVKLSNREISSDHCRSFWKARRRYSTPPGLTTKSTTPGNADSRYSTTSGLTTKSTTIVSSESGLNTAVVLGLVLAFIVIAGVVFFVIMRGKKKYSKGRQHRDTQRQDEVIQKPKPITQMHRIFTALTRSLQRRKSSTERQRSTPLGQQPQSNPQSSEEPEGSFSPPMKVLVVIDRTNKHISDKAHALVQNLRRDPKLEIISNLENSNPIIYEQREVSWYQTNFQSADRIIFINGVAVLRKLDEHRNSLGEFSHAIFSHFSSKTYARKRNIFLEYNENDLDYINEERTWSKCCKAFKVNEDLIVDDEFLCCLRRSTNTSSVNEQASVGRQQEEQFRTSSV